MISDLEYARWEASRRLCGLGGRLWLDKNGLQEFLSMKEGSAKEVAVWAEAVIHIGPRLERYSVERLVECDNFVLQHGYEPHKYTTISAARQAIAEDAKQN